MLSAKPCSSSGVHFEDRRDDAGLAGAPGLRLADADRDDQRGDERDAVPGAEAPRLRRAPTRNGLSTAQIGAVRDHAGVYPGMRSARSQRPITQTSTPTSDT